MVRKRGEKAATEQKKISPGWGVLLSSELRTTTTYERKKKRKSEKARNPTLLTGGGGGRYYNLRFPLSYKVKDWSSFRQKRWQYHAYKKGEEVHEERGLKF